MADYNIDINVNMGGSQGNFQTLIDSVNNLNASFQKVGTAASTAGSAAKQSFADSMAIMAQYQNSVKKVGAEISNLKKQILDENEALKKKKISDADHKANVDKLYASLKQLQTAQRQYNSVLGQTTTQASMASKAVTGLTTTFNKLGAVLGISFGLYGVFRGLQSVIETIAEFDLAQKKLRSILGETADGMKELSKSAIDLGKNSIFGAKGVTELQIELAKLGFTKNEIIAMQGAINDLAIATQEDLAGSAEVVANIIKTFELTATETRDVVNVMGKAFNDSALGLSNFRESIKYVAPVANQAGLSFRETVAALELLSNAGLKGSLAGTGLINVLKAMMDSNSKLSKSLGGTVSGWEGFTTVLQRAREEGWNMQDVFGLITQRATGAFSTFMEGLPTLDKMADKLLDVSNIIRNQASVQMESISYQATLLKKSWDALVLSIDSGNGIISKSIKFVLKSLGIAIDAINADPGQMFLKLKDYAFQIRQILSMDGISDETRKELEKYEALLTSKSNDVREMSKRELAIDLSNVNDLILGTEELFSKNIVELAKRRIDQLKIEGKTYNEFEAARNAAILTIGEEMKALENAGKKNIVQYKILQEALLQIEKLDFKRIDDGIKGEDDKKKAIQDRYKAEFELLKNQEKWEAEKIKIRVDGAAEIVQLSENQFKFAKLYADLELKQAIELGEDKEEATKRHYEAIRLLTIEHSNDMVDIFEKMQKEIINYEKASNVAIRALRNKQTKEYLDSWQDRMDDINDFMADYQFDNPLINLLFGGQIAEGVFSKMFTEDEAKQFAKAFETAFDSIGDSLNDYVDSWVDATDRIVDQLNRQIDETQSALETEIELMEAGYASNVSLKRKELEDLKKEREKALAEQKKAQQAQVAADTITQLSSLVTAAAQIFKGLTAVLPVAGIPIAIGLIAAMFGAFAAAKAKAMQTAGIGKFEQGGWVGGKRHSQGGTHIEAEHGEFIIKRSSAIKHKEMIEAINSDNKYELNRIYMNNLKGQIVNARVSLDDSKDLKAIRSLLEKQGRQVEYSGSYRIEKVGNVTTKIRLN